MHSMDGLITGINTIGPLFGAAAYLTNLIVNGITLAYPSRPTWAAWLMAMSVALLATMILAGATLPLATVWDRQVWSQIVLVGLLAGAGASGANSVQRKADETRVQAVRDDAAAERIRTITGGR